MLSNVAKLCAAFAVIGLMVSSADAQRIHPRCMTMRDKVGCTCALENDGGIGRRPGSDRKRWYSKRGGNRQVNEAFVQCMIRNGRG